MADEMAGWALDAGVHTPHLDAVAARGTVFDAAYTPSPICVPARAAIACGQCLHALGGYWSSSEAYDGRVRSWAHAVRAMGVPVTSIGKLHFRSGEDDTGFSEQILPMHIAGKGWVRGLLRQPLAGYDATRELAEDIGTGWTDYTRYDAQVTEAACDWIAQQAAGAPWCAFVSWVSPHYPLRAPEQDIARYDPSACAAPAEAVPDHPILRELAGFFDHDPWFTPETRGIARAAYRGLCTFLDRQVGAVLGALDAAGLVDETLVIFTADHGEMLGEKGFWGKSTMYEASARVPLILAGPGVAPGRRVDPVSLIDIAPTIAQSFGASVRPYGGRPLFEAPLGSRTVLSEYHDGGASVGITMVRWNDGAARWKYMHYAQGHPPQLFELGADPSEHEDLAAHRPDVVAEARRRLARWMDPEVIDARAHADQARRVAELGGREALLAEAQWNFTPTGQG